MSDLIFALASAKGRAGISVIRISGKDSISIISQYCGNNLPKSGKSLRKFFNENNKLVDNVLILTFQRKASFTNEEVVEIHSHGSIAVVSEILRVLSSNSNMRMAYPGEFTKRALENNQLDLIQVEGLADLLEAETEEQRKLAIRVLNGDLSKKVIKWRENLIHAVSLLEVIIDFVDEDIPTNVIPEVLELILTVQSEIQSEIDGSFAAERIRDGFQIAIIGKPNIGKSTLLNAIAGREVAITSEIEGTTRDIIEVQMHISGFAVVLFDTAGLRDTEDTIEKIGVEKTLQRAKQADIRIFLTENSDLSCFSITPKKTDIIISGKADINKKNEYLGVSGKTEEGIDTLLNIISTKLLSMTAGIQMASNLRQRVAMEQAIEYFNIAIEKINIDSDNIELISADLRASINSLNSLIGTVGVEDYLDEIFSRFCLGK